MDCRHLLGMMIANTLAGRCRARRHWLHMGLMGMGPEQRLLIVDDELLIVQMLEEFFRMEGYETVCAQSAEEALGAVYWSSTEERA